MMTVRDLIEQLEEYGDHVEVKICVETRGTEVFHPVTEVRYDNAEGCVALYFDV
jgi:hypothetical protein